MANRRVTCRGISRHRSYTVDEVARALHVSKGTVRRWLANGLASISDRKPLLILGDEVARFLADRKTEKQTCKLQECYCFSCRTPREPAGGMVELTVLPSLGGQITALCCTCLGTMHKRISKGQIPALSALLDVSIKQASPRIGKSTDPCLNDHFER